MDLIKHSNGKRYRLVLPLRWNEAERAYVRLGVTDERGFLTYQALHPVYGYPWQAQRTARPEEFTFLFLEEGRP